jgi:hypothetical protein
VGCHGACARIYMLYVKAGTADKLTHDLGGECVEDYLDHLRASHLPASFGCRTKQVGSVEEITRWREHTIIGSASWDVLSGCDETKARDMEIVFRYHVHRT